MKIARSPVKTSKPVTGSKEVASEILRDPSLTKPTSGPITRSRLSHLNTMLGVNDMSMPESNATSNGTNTPNQDTEGVHDVDSDDISDYGQMIFDQHDQRIKEQEKQITMLQETCARLEALLLVHNASMTNSASTNAAPMIVQPSMDSMVSSLVTQLVPSIAEACAQGITGAQPAMVTRVDSHESKFKMNAQERLKNVEIKSGEQLTVSSLLRIMNLARDIDLAALKAMTRPPSSSSEWKQVFHFYCLHLDQGLYTRLWPHISLGKITSVDSFWDLVFEELFPKILVPDVFDSLLQSYFPWNESSGLDRWYSTTTSLIRYMAYCEGLWGNDLHYHIAKKQNAQFLRLIHKCSSSYRQNLHREFNSLQAPIKQALSQGLAPSISQYEDAVSSFMEWMKNEITLFGYMEVFGYKQASKSSPLPSATKAPQLRQVQFSPVEEEQFITPPSYSQVTEHGSQSPTSYLRKLHTSAAAKQFTSSSSSAPKDLAPYAPNGKKRTWGWKQRTVSIDGQGRKFCRDPVGDVKGCEYYGDVLDAQGLCSYCTKPGHVKAECAVYAENVRKFKAAQNKSRSSSQQEN
jgi:hypothetical protein